jgi:hypothetical protein
VRTVVAVKEVVLAHTCLVQSSAASAQQASEYKTCMRDTKHVHHMPDAEDYWHTMPHSMPHKSSPPYPLYAMNSSCSASSYTIRSPLRGFETESASGAAIRQPFALRQEHHQCAACVIGITLRLTSIPSAAGVDT